MKHFTSLPEGIYDTLHKNMDATKGWCLRNICMLAVSLFTCFIAGIYVSVWAHHVFNPRHSACTSDLAFINPEPGCELFEAKLEEMSALDGVLRADVDHYIKEGRATRVAVFSRDLLSKRYVGVNDMEDFFMASLLKVPLAIAYHRYAETTPEIFSKTVTYDENADDYSRQSIVPSEKLIPKTEYRIDDLLLRALIYSDNTAARVLAAGMSREFFNGVLFAIGLRTISDGQEEDFVNARSYAAVFKGLYNSSFLTRKASNEILEQLTHGTYKNGARKLLPNTVSIASKFGERTVLDPTTGEVVLKQLHECGVVYAKNGKEPYTFCILTEGKNFEDLEIILQNISLTLYSALSK